MKTQSQKHQNLKALGASLAVGVGLALLPMSALQAGGTEHFSAEKYGKRL